VSACSLDPQATLSAWCSGCWYGAHGVGESRGAPSEMWLRSTQAQSGALGACLVGTVCVRHGSWCASGAMGRGDEWRKAEEEAMPSLEEVLRHAPSLHFNIELKFPADDSVDISDADVAHMLDHVTTSEPPLYNTTITFLQSLNPS